MAKENKKFRKNLAFILRAGHRPDVIGTTKVEEHHKISFRCDYPDDSGRTTTEAFDNYKEGRKYFDKNKNTLGDVHFFACLMTGKEEDDECIDEELIDSFWDGETGL